MSQLIHAEVTPLEVRYIKLGSGGCWAKQSIEEGRLAFGYHSIPHDMCMAKQWQSVRQLLDDRKSEGAKTAGVKEVMTFYEMNEQCLWVTFASGHLWWGFAEPDIVWVGDGEDGRPPRYRPMIGGWKNASTAGVPLKISSMSSKLTKTANFRSTICTVPERDYLLRRINGVKEPVVLRAEHAREQMIESASDMVRGLHWVDFETLADLIFARSGWQRSSRVGENITDVDIIMEQPTTAETAFVQVKSQASQTVLDDYLERFRQSGFDRFFFVCHSSRKLTLPEGSHLHLFQGRQLAEAAVKNGLFDWLVHRSG